MVDIGFTHIALPVSNIEQSINFYSVYGNMRVVHQRTDDNEEISVVWLSDATRPFVIVLIATDIVHPQLSPLAHLGIGCQSKAEIDRLAAKARQEGLLLEEPTDSGYPVGYWAFIRDPDGHTLEISYGQEVGLTVAKNTDG